MAYQKLQVGRVYGPVLLNDLTDIPDVSSVAISLESPLNIVTTVTNVGNTETTLVAANTVDFSNLGVKSGMIAVNVDGDGKPKDAKGTVFAIKDNSIKVTGIGPNAGTQFQNGDNIAIFGPPAPNNGCVLYVGGNAAGVVDVEVLTISGDTATFKSLPIGSFIPVQVRRLLTGTSSDANVLALW